ncbi:MULTISPECIES: response regulator [Mediterraneibacter]|uniref:response regulator n=1 Tax=Mediterraneibacter TaxID=2316020 RepID=UPI0013C34F1D|nr:response regulator [Mediterraneibacter massiliensis]
MYRVLLADDEVLIREAISENMDWEGAGFSLCAVCENGREAIEAIQEKQPDLVLTDICMPYADGLDVAKYVQENCPQCKVAIISGYDNFEYAKKAIQYQVGAYILKPVTARELTDVLLKLHAELEKEHEEREKQKKIREAFEQNKEYFKERFLSQLIREKSVHQDIEGRMRFYGIYLEGECFSVVQIRYIHQEDPSDILLFALYNVVEELVREETCCEVFQDIGNITTLIFCGESAYQVEEEIQRIADVIRSHVEKFFHESVMMIAGVCVWDRADLRQSYENAKRAAEYEFLFEGNELVFGKEFVNRDTQAVIDTSVFARQMVSQMKRNDRAGVHKEVERFFHEMRRLYIQKARTGMYVQNLMTRLSLFADETGIDEKTVLQWEKPLFEEIVNQGRAEQMEELLLRFCLSIMEAASKEREDLGKCMAEKALEYIDQNYQDSSLSLNSVSKALAISTSYFSALFKTQTGETFIEALTKIRMEKAKELLCTTQLKSYEIAEKVGYSDAHYFGSIFKKNEGMTPKEYAKRNKR